MASVTFDTVSLRYPSGAVGLHEIDLQIADGEFIALVGPSGSGKTTLLRTIAGFLTPTTGTVRIGDRTVADAARPRDRAVTVPPEHRELGMVFQQHAVWPHWNVGRNVEYPLRRAGVARAERAARVDEALELVGLAGYARRDPATLSGGQRQRVALARALVARPRVLLLDEALSALDEPLRDRLRLELHSLTRELGLTVVHVTHDRSEALALADRIVVLDAGKVQQIGTPEELVTRPATGLVARFLSDATLIEGEVSGAQFAATQHPLHLSLTDAAASGPATLAVLPADVDVIVDPLGDAVVRSSLFSADGGDLVVEWAGVSLRVKTRGLRPAVGARVSVSVRRGIVYSLSGAGVTARPDRVTTLAAPWLLPAPDRAAVSA